MSDLTALGVVALALQVALAALQLASTIALRRTHKQFRDSLRPPRISFQNFDAEVDEADQEPPPFPKRRS